MQIKIDDRQFRQAMQQYLEETKKDLAYVLNRQALNVAIKASQATPPAERSKVTELPKEEWWPKYVAKRIKAGVKVGRGKRRKTVQGSFTQAQARRVSAEIIRQRLQRLGWLKSGWFPALRKLNQLVRGQIGSAMRGASGIRNPRGDASPAREGINPRAMITNASATDDQALRRIMTGLQRGLDLAAADMLKYLRERCQRTADRFSAKR